MGQRVMRMALVAGVAVLALLLLLATCGGGKDDEPDAGKDGKDAKKPTKAGSPAPSAVPRLPAPAAYDTARGWRIVGGSTEYALSQEPALVGHVERGTTGSFVLRTYDVKTGKRAWSGTPWRSLSDPAYFPGLLSLTKGDRHYFVTWSYGKVGGADSLSTGDSVLALDVYDARDGNQKHYELPWQGVPVVSTTGPAILVTNGAATAAVVDPETGRVTPYAANPKSLGMPKGCKNCGARTEVRALTAKGLLVSGRSEFWVKGGWYSRAVAPKGLDPASGVPTSVTSAGQILAKWQKKKPDNWERWAVHDANTGKVLASVDCPRPAIEPGEYPQAVTAPGGHYLVAGNLAFDLRSPAPKGAKTGHCLQGRGGAKPVTLTSVTDDGIAYGTTSTTSAGGTPVEVPLSTVVPAALTDGAVVPERELAGTGLFRWTDRRDRSQLIGYPRR
ncbi:hypothetical protein [Streptomyces sp. NPDC051561]|uniref:hypothetical protein n=1 Tax=Streptomyces sp. NPDC051561 TaxID=3365658 RepID=UPI0037879B6F